MGLPSPVPDYAEKRISLDKLCIQRPAETYLIKSCSGYSQIGIMTDSLLIVDSSRKLVDGSMVIADVEGKFRIFVMRMLPRFAPAEPLSRKVVKHLDGDFTLTKERRYSRWSRTH